MTIVTSVREPCCNGCNGVDTSLMTWGTVECYNGVDTSLMTWGTVECYNGVDTSLMTWGTVECYYNGVDTS